MSFNQRIFLGALIGVGLGIAMEQSTGAPWVHSLSYALGLVSGVFIDLLKMVLVPLVFTSVAAGVANLRAHDNMHRVWRVTLLCSLATSTLSISLGLLAAHWFHPGKNVTLATLQAAAKGFQPATLALPEFFSRFLHGVFMNPVAAMAQGTVLPIVVFALLIGVALIKGQGRFRQVESLLQELFALTLLIVQGIMWLAPVGIAALLAQLIAGSSLAVLGSLADFAAVVVGTTLFHGIVVLPLLLWLLTRIRPWGFWRGARPALLTAFATSSSSATMPVTMRCLEQDLGVSRDVTGFVVPLGAHLNMDGTALYEAAAALFVANLCGIALDPLQQLVVCLTTMLAAVGAPGIPSAGMVTMILVLQSVGLPAEAVALLLPFDRLLDTVRTAVNVEGDMVTSLIVQRLAMNPGAIRGQ